MFSANLQDTLIFEPGPKEHGKSLSSLDFGMDFDRSAKRDRSFLASCSQDGTAIIWNLPGKTVRHKLVHFSGTQSAETPVNQVRVRPGGTAVALAGSDGRVTIWSPRTGSLIRDLKGHTGRVQDLSWSADGRLLASCDDDGLVFVWEAATGKQVMKFDSQGNDEVLTALTVSPDGQSLWVGSRGNALYRFEVASGKRTALEKATGEEPAAMEFSPNGLYFLTTEAKQVVLRDGQSGAPVRSFSRHTGNIRDARWSRDSERVFSAGDGGQVFEWNVSSGAVLASGDVGQYVNGIAICLIGGVEKLALAKPAAIFEIQK